MSPTRTPKPPDKGTPDPKPSRKVALNELLRSLQDLVSNELAIEPAGAKPAPSAAPTTPAAPDSAPAPPEPDLQTGETADSSPSPFPVDESFETESITLEGLPDVPAETAPAAPAKATIPPGGLQQELPYLHAVPAPPVATSLGNESLLVEPETPIRNCPAPNP